jgi:hypothetical protein
MFPRQAGQEFTGAVMSAAAELVKIGAVSAQNCASSS